MITSKRLVILILSVLLFSQNGFSQKNNDHSLLWKISGNGLKSPSYLFGTMHVRNKQAFNFKDSLYHFIEKADGFAMELHPDSMGQVVTAFLNGRIQTDENSSYKDFSEKEFEKVLEKISKDKSVKRKSRKEKMDIMLQKLTEEKVEKDSSMNTFMDAFLYALAKENEKNIYGLEEVEDQITAFTYLRSGLKLNALSENIDKIQYWSTPPIYDYYYKERLDSIYSFYNTFFTDSTLNGFLYDRNIRMATKMDSIMQFQTLFTAVGAGHLPGEEGVISLLRKKGYLVESVHSDKKIFAGTYQRKEYDEKWVTYENNVLGYKFETPTAITKQTSANGASVEYSLDLINGLMFMNISRPLKSAERKLGLDSLFNIHNEEMLKNVNGFTLSKKEINLKGYKAIQSDIGTLKDGYTRLTYLHDDRNLHILITSSEKKENLENKSVNRFLESFTIMPAKMDWKEVNDKTSFFSIKIPNGEEVSASQLNENDETVVYGGYSGFHPPSASIFSVYHSKAKAGNELLSANTFFNSYIYNLQSAMEGGEFSSTDTIMFGYPAKKFSGISDNNEKLQGFLLRRNNIGYFVTAEYDAANEDVKMLDEFFGSFALNKFDEAGWQNYKEEGFSVKAPAAFKNFAEETSGKEDFHFIATDKNSNVSYHVEKERINKYYWAVNEDSFYNYWKGRLVKYTDTVVRYDAWAQNGATGREMITYDSIDKVSRRWIISLNWPHIFTVYANKLPGQDNSKNFDEFFTSFRFDKLNKNDSLYSRTPDLLFHDLQSEDSTTFHDAYAALDLVSFYGKDISFLLAQTLTPYPSPDYIYSSVHQKLWSEMRFIARNNTTSYKEINQFVNTNYPKADEHILNQRSEMLAILADQKTADSYNNINRLISNYPELPLPHTFFYKLYDSLELTRSLYPAILKYAEDTLAALPLASITAMLLDSNMLTVDEIKQAEKAYTDMANNKLKAIAALDKNEYDYDYEIQDVIRLLGFINSGSSEPVVRKYSKVKNLAIRFAAITSLIKGNRSVSAGDIKKLAESDNYRVRLYESLEKSEKLSLFPAAYATQKEMAKGYIFYNSNEEDEMADGDMSFIYIKNIDTTFEGAPKRFLLFKVLFEGEEYDEAAPPPPPPAGKDAYLAIAGPFDLNDKSIGIPVKDNISGLYYDSNFDPSQTDVFFRNYIKQVLKYR